MTPDTPAVPPALTPAEWATLTRGERWHPDPEHMPPFHISAAGALMMPDCYEPWPVHPTERHALAALALHGQPFGVTHAHLAGLRRLCAIAMESIADHPGIDALDPEVRAAIDDGRRALAVLAALLPPEP